MPSCDNIRQELVNCMLKSDCVLVERNPIKECFKPQHADKVPEECQQLRKSFSACKRSLLDMRKRFRSIN
ncbi:hypothetical protein K493DRAFT_236556 [Basidiobolus meristosporus CBS 931.73]|uniref:Cytochrome c oxidase assembly factor 5 n=1 Tax=Basidiobolus meristosporus CBS 931.73 TaxID=1314790 RepID=A0A1Y1XRU4_9FUNG|nr:hypothetical protein K493DRAFT_236556 [Basidiobolus meristosporus CBS 931.73]|eukprot:ORX88481.1 hypothetical protein K493DRAFT_236556 [Basidiobolus meristosporus CBS 931.73]